MRLWQVLAVECADGSVEQQGLLSNASDGGGSIGRDHLASGSIASPNRETEPMKGASGAAPIGRCPIPQRARPGCRYITVARLAWASRSTPARSSAAMGRPTARRIDRVLLNDPAIGVMRHAVTGYDAAIACAREMG